MRPRDRPTPPADPYTDALPSRLDLSPHHVDVVHLRLDAPADDLRNVLDAGERARAARLRFAHDRRRFVVAHALLRVVIARAVGCPAHTLRLTTGPFGKPRLAHTPLEVRFNLSHSGERALLALSLGREVGIDIEAHRPVDELAIAAAVFAPGEVHALEGLSGAEREAAFYRRWTQREALGKALGLGLSLPPGRIARAVDGSHRWRVVPLPSERGYSAALASERGDWGVRRWSLDPTSVHGADTNS